MMTYPKRLIEVDLPIKRISAHARREKSIRHEHKVRSCSCQKSAWGNLTSGSELERRVLVGCACQSALTTTRSCPWS